MSNETNTQCKDKKNTDQQNSLPQDGEDNTKPSIFPG